MEITQKVWHEYNVQIQNANMNITVPFHARNSAFALHVHRRGLSFRIPVSGGKFQNPQYELNKKSKTQTVVNVPDITVPPADVKPEKVEHTTSINTSKEDIQKVNKKGIQIFVQNLKKKYGGYSKFKVTVKNTTKKSMSVGAKIFLYKGKSSKVGTGIIFASIKPGETKSNYTYCDSGKAYSTWKFTLDDIYDNTELNFKDDELDKMQKELDDMEKELEKMDKELKDMENEFKDFK